MAGAEQTGNSNQRERSGILGVLGDREFIGGHWWQWLDGQGIPYLIRMKENQGMTDRHGHSCAVRFLFAGLERGKSRVLRNRRRVGQQWVWLSGMKLDSGELLILAANQGFRQPLAVYALRWQIENLFQCLKGRGMETPGGHAFENEKTWPA